MRYFAPLRIIGLLAAAAFLQGGPACSSLLASCGDYVMVGAHGISQSAGSGQVSMPDDLGRPDGGRLPCRGPNCSGRSGPAPKQPTSVSTNYHDWGLSIAASWELPFYPLGFVVGH